MTHNARSIVLFAALLVPACGGSQSGPPEPPPAPPPQAQATPAPGPQPSAQNLASSTSTDQTAKKAETTPAGSTPVVRYTGAFAAPESVLYDDEADRYLVSNINGKPPEKDGNGYISVLSPDGQVTTPKWIAGGANKVKLDAPKGLAISQGILYAADITVVRKFDVKTGAPKGDIPIAGATFLNDVAAAPDGMIYVSDSGLKAGKNDMEPSGTDAVYVIDKGKVRPLAKSKELGQPNGLLATDKGLVVVTMGSNEIYRLEKDAKRKDVTTLPEGGLDGVVAVGDSIFVTSWKASAIYRGQLGGKFEVAIPNMKGPADIGYDKKRGRLLVPHLTEDVVEAYEIK